MCIVSPCGGSDKRERVKSGKEIFVGFGRAYQQYMRVGGFCRISNLRMNLQKFRTFIFYSLNINIISGTKLKKGLDKCTKKWYIIVIG